MGSTPQDASTLNGQTLGTKYFYSVGAASVQQGGVNGVNTYSGTVAVSQPAGISGLVTDTSSGGNGSFTLTLNGVSTSYTVLGSSADGQNLVIQAGGSYYVIADSGTQPTSNISFNSGNPYLSPACFLAGTLILTTRGEISVEELQAGDLVVTADGEALAIRWIGRRTYDCRTYIKPDEVLPIRVARDAIAPGMPARDTFVSRGHALAFDDDGGVTISAHELANGITIAQVDADTVEYWHIELDRHDVIFANALPAESYRECGGRALYQTADGVPATVESADHRFRRVMFDETSRAVRNRLASRAHGLKDTAAVAA